MPITFQCGACSKEYRVKDELAGKQVKCAKCGKPIKIPIPTPPAAPPDDEDEYELEPPAETAAPTAPVFGLEEDGAPEPAAGRPSGKKSSGGKKSARRKPASPAPASLPDDDLVLAEDPKEKQEPEETVDCPGCGKKIKARAVLCINCGLDLRTGEKHQHAQLKKGVFGKLLGGLKRKK